MKKTKKTAHQKTNQEKKQKTLKLCLDLTCDKTELLNTIDEVITAMQNGTSIKI